MAKTKAGSNATFTGTQRGLSYVKDGKSNVVYAYSGAVTMASSATEYTLLEFATGRETIEAWVDFRNVTLNTNNNTTSKWYLNGSLVLQAELESSETALPGWVGRLVIPPYTTFKQTGQADGSGIITLGVMTGRIYA